MLRRETESLSHDRNKVCITYKKVVRVERRAFDCKVIRVFLTLTVRTFSHITKFM